MECLAWLKKAGALHLAKLCIMVAVTVLVLVFNVQRPKVTRIYHTNDPSDTQRNGVSYFCGCSLPTSLETPQIPTEPPMSSSRNVCYDRSSLSTANVLVFPNFPGVELLVDDIKDAYGIRRDQSSPATSRLVDGYISMTEAHNLDWGDDRALFENYTNTFPISDLDVDETESELFVDVEDVKKLLDFPAPFLAMKFAFRCSICSSCDLETVNKIFQNISSNPVLSAGNHVSWGECTYWGDGDECAPKNRYQAMCTMYPNTRVPPAFAIQTFFQDFNKLPDIDDIRPFSDPDRVNHTSFVSNELFMYLIRLVPHKIVLNFLDIQKGSSAWVSLLNSYPTFSRSCSSMSNESTILSGTSVCNLYKSRANEYRVVCRDMTDERKCRQIHANMTINDVPNSTWNDFHVERDDWQGLMCPPYINERRPVYLVKQAAVAAEGKGTLLDEVLRSETLLDAWQNRWYSASGDVDGAPSSCTQTYRDIVSHTTQDESLRWYERENITLFMETECSESDSEYSDGYCWLTGRYHNLTDIPGDPWRTMTDTWTSEDRFVCYSIADQGVVKWFIFLVGILFGWLGTIDLAFTWIARFCCKPTSRAEQSFDGTAHASGDEKNTGKDAGGTTSDSAEMVAPQANSETDSRPDVGLESNVASEPSLRSAGGGPSSPIIELARKFSQTHTYSKITEI